MRVTYDGENYHMAVSPGELADLRTAILFSITSTRDNSVLYHDIVTASRDALHEFCDSSGNELGEHLKRLAF